MNSSANKLNSSNNRTTASPSATVDATFDPSIYIAYAMAPQIPLIVLGNLLVLVSVFYYRHMRTNPNILVATLAANDLLIGSVSAPTMVYMYLSILTSQNNDPNFYNWLWVIPNTFSILAILFVLLITIERFVAVVVPLKLKIIFSKGKIIVYISIMVVITVVWCVQLGTGFIWGVNLIANVPYNYVTIYAFYILPLTGILVLYSITLYKFRQYQRENLMAADNKARLSKAEQKLTASLSIVIVFLILAYVPNAIWWSMSYFVNSFAMNVFSLVSNILQVMNSLVNVFIYAVKLPQFRKCFIRLLHCPVKTRKHESSNSTGMSSNAINMKTKN